jgi:hypothetical protein
MEVIRHQEIVADKPCGCLMQPYRVQSPMDGWLCEPPSPALGANREKYPVGSRERDVYSLCRSASSSPSKRQAHAPKHIAFAEPNASR